MTRTIEADDDLGAKRSAKATTPRRLLAGMWEGSPELEALRRPTAPWSSLDDEQKALAVRLNLSRWADRLPRDGEAGAVEGGHAFTTAEREALEQIAGFLRKAARISRDLGFEAQCAAAIRRDTRGRSDGRRLATLEQLERAMAKCSRWRLKGDPFEIRQHQEDCRDSSGRVCNDDMPSCVLRRTGHRLVYTDLSRWLHLRGLSLEDLRLRLEPWQNTDRLVFEFGPRREFIEWSDAEAQRATALALNLERAAHLFDALASVPRGDRPRKKGRKAREATRDLLRWAKGRITQRELARQAVDWLDVRRLLPYFMKRASVGDTNREELIAIVADHFTSVRARR